MKKRLLLMWLLIPAAHAAEFGDFYREAATAWQNQDYAGMAEQARLGLEMRPGYPLMNFLLAMALAAQDEDEQALQILSDINALRIRVAALDAENFPTLTDNTEFMRLATESTALDELVIGQASEAFSIPQHDFLAESLTRDDKGQRWFVGSVHHGMVIVRNDDGSQARFTRGEPLGAPLGMSVDQERGLLWVASGVVPESRSNNAIRGVLAYDLDSGELLRSALLPLPDANPGDIFLNTAGDLYVSDGANGVIYRMIVDETELSAVITGLSSPQGMTMDEHGTLWVADYRGGLIAYRDGLSRLDEDSSRRSSRTVYLQSGDASLYGIDGLVYRAGNLIAIQNGITPHRILSIRLDNGKIGDISILAMNLPGFDEPTLGALSGDAYYFVANSQWSKFADPENPPGPDDANPPSIMRIELSGH